MARRRKLSEVKENIIAGLIEKYNIQTANDIQEALKDCIRILRVYEYKSTQNFV